MELKEKISKLADLFALRQPIDEAITKLLEDKQIKEIESRIAEPQHTTYKKKRKIGKYTKHNPMPETVKDEIRQKLQQGIKGKDIAKEYGISNSVIYQLSKIKSTNQRTVNNAINNYVCVDGHEFKSKMKPGEVMCPTCHSLNCDLGTLNGEVQID